MKKGVNPSQQVEIELRKWLRSHHCVIGSDEAFKIGATPYTVRRKLSRGEWDQLYRGVYRDTAGPPGPYQDLRAAFVATRGLGVVSHASAAWVWDLVPRPPGTPELTIPIGCHSSWRPNLTIHRSRDLERTKPVNRNAILVTNPLRTLVDLAGSAPPQVLTEAVDSALARHLVTTEALMAEIDRLSRPGRDGVGTLRRHLWERGFVGAPEPSVLEAHTRRLVDSTRLPHPEVEVRVGEDGEYRLDIAWRPVFFAVEVDGYAWHFSPEHQERDVTRRNQLQQAGWTLLVYTWRQVMRQSGLVATEIIETHRRLAARRQA
ncbi:MAG: hypothetical protein QOE07_2204 [Acidimicrobiaceae bacterium]|nr:hypothetical protein [Acidimicrobiaceae bacterium]